jgi:hypothetical protein
MRRSWLGQNRRPYEIFLLNRFSRNKDRLRRSGLTGGK